MSRRLANGPVDAPSRGPRCTIFEFGGGVGADFAEEAGAHGLVVGALDVPDVDVAGALGRAVRRVPPLLPRVSEPEMVRHYDHLAEMNFGVETGTYPLGSCTMKHNPTVSEELAALAGFTGLHPYQPDQSVQGALALMVGLADALAEISGLPGVTLQPAAGAHGELTALMMFRAALAERGDVRRKVIIPDTAHGTNPASVAMCGYEVVTVPSGGDGLLDVDSLREVLDTDVAAIMLTNPNTLGLFESRVAEVTTAVHAVGAFAYCDGANMNALLGVARPGDMGFDALHLNLHKTFATPHGGGGPGAGPVCVTAELGEYLPGPLPVRREDDSFGWETPARSIGRVRSFFGNFGVLVRAYAYIRALGADGLREVAEQAVLSAAYLKERLRGAYDLPFDRPCLHEFVLSALRQRRDHGLGATDIAKRLLDYGVHAPTVHFPLIVEEAIMIEPTETEPLDALDAFAHAMLTVADEAARDPGLVRTAPHTTPVRRVDEARAARHPDLRWRPPVKQAEP